MTGAGAAYVWTRGRWRVRAGEWLAYAAVRAFRAATWPVPIWALTAALAPLGGWLALALAPMRRRAEANLALVRPDLDRSGRRALTAEAGRQFLRLGIEYAHLDRWAARVAVEAEGEVPDGAVLVTAHYGNWEAIRLAAAARGVECGIIYRAFNNRYLDRFTQAVLPRAGRPVLHKGRPGMRALLTHLKDGGTALILVDQRSSGAPLLPFMGHPAETATAAAALARATGARLVPAIARRDADGRRFRVRFGEAVATDDPAAAMAEVNARLAAWIAEEPGQWLWFHRRWRVAARRRGAQNRK